MSELELKTVTRTQGNTQALKDGSVRLRGYALDFVEVEPIIDAFRRMVHGLEFDVSEMAIIIAGPVAVEELFAPSTRTLVA
jgi:4,5-dihydroxyphthalate decarboxylase